MVLGVLAGRINTTYKVSKDPWTAHRALYIPRPHPVMSGQYSCTVSTFEDEDTESAHFLVWSESMIALLCSSLPPSFPSYVTFILFRYLLSHLPAVVFRIGLK